MKKILLASTALVAFSGAAFADVTFTGSAKLGYNTSDNVGNSASGFSDAAAIVGPPAVAAVVGDDDEEGFYGDLDIVAGFSTELDNGLTAAASLNLDNLGDSSTDGTENGFDYTLSLTSDTAGLFYGDTKFAAETHWASAGDMESDGFSEADGEVVLRGDVTFGAVSASVSYALADADDAVNAFDDLTQLSFGAAADFGNVNVAIAYQEETNEVYTGNGDFTVNEVFGLSVGSSFGGADVRLAYAEDNNSDSLGLKVAYPFGPVTATAYFVSESAGDDNLGINIAYSDGPLAISLDYQDDQGTAKMGLEGSYDIGNGVMAYAGFLNQDSTENRFYVAGTYDLGSGASLLVSYASDEDNVDGDEVGAGDYQDGTTVEVTFAF
ncbi:porin [Octadecabacter antarcticus]|nr:porin [Octadecabacter antarcticus]